MSSISHDAKQSNPAPTCADGFEDGADNDPAAYGLPTSAPNSVAAIAERYHGAGLNVIPIRLDGSKKTPLSWKEYQSRRSTKAEHAEWFGGANPLGIAILGGAISGNLEILDFDREANTVFSEFSDEVETSAPGLMRLFTIVSTPSGGAHLYYRCEKPPGGNQKLAKNESGETRIETRAEGGYCIAPGSPAACHPSGRTYDLIQGDLANIPTITTAERENLLEIARSFNVAMATPPPPPPSPWQQTIPTSGRLSPVERAKRWLDKAEPAISGAGGHNRTFAVVCAIVHGFALEEADALEALSAWNATCVPPWSEAELRHKIGDAQKANHEKPRGYLLDDPPAAPSSSAAAPSSTNAGASTDGKKDKKEEEAEALEEISCADLIEQYPTLRPTVIDGFLRAGETMNVIAAPKTGKSFLSLAIACSVARGVPLFGHPTTQGNVLVIDNELHPETHAGRLRRITEAYSPPGEEHETRRRISVLSLRGRLQNLHSLGAFFRRKRPGQYSLIIIDAWYRCLPIGTDENDNGAVADLYNTLDAYADYLQSAFLLIHHTSKGAQAEKAITDVGSGAGSQSRAADTHLVLRQHDSAGAVVLDGVTRSFAPIKPMALRFEWPMFRVAHDLDPADLATRKPRKRKEQPEAAPPIPETAPPREPEATVWTSALFAERFGTAEPKTKAAILDEARLAGIPSRLATSLFSLAIERAQLHAKSAQNDARIIHVQNVPFAAQKPRRKRNRQAKREDA